MAVNTPIMPVSKHEQTDEEGQFSVLDVVPRPDDRDHRQERGEQDQQHRDAVHSHVVVDAEALDPDEVLLELEGGRVGVERRQHVERSDAKAARLVTSAVAL